MTKINLKKIAKDYGFHMEVTTYPLLKDAKPVVKMWIDTQIEPILKAFDVAESYIHIPMGVTTKPVNGKINFWNAVCIYNDSDNEQFLRERLDKVLKTYVKRLRKYNLPLAAERILKLTKLDD